MLRSSVLAAIVGCILVGNWIGGGAAYACSIEGPTATITGRLVAIYGDTAEFDAESVKAPKAANPRPFANGGCQFRCGPRAPHMGARVSVEYPHEVVQFLKVGRRYTVGLWSTLVGNDSYWSSGIARRPDDACQGDIATNGTTYADGLGIDTAIVNWPAVGLWAAVTAGALWTTSWFRARGARRAKYASWQSRLRAEPA